MTHKEGQGKLELSSPCNGIYGGQSKMFNAVTCVLGNFAYNLLETACEKVTEREVNPQSPTGDLERISPFTSVRYQADK